MSDEPIVRLAADDRAPDVLRAILRAVDRDGPTDAELAGLARRVAPLLATPAPIAPPRWRSARTMWIGIAIVGVGIGIALLMRRDRSPEVPSIVPSPQPVVPRARAAPISPVLDAPAEPSPPPPPPEPPKRVTSIARPHPAAVNPEPAPSSDPSAPTEVALLEQARHALREGDADRALALAAEHARRFADGVLGEEREALVIEALVKLGRTDEATARWSKFAAAYPRSNYRARLERLIVR